MAAADTSANAQRASSDQPIQSSREDVLGRRGFADQVRSEIAAAPRRGGFVIAVNGTWGSGKTSIINMAVEPLSAESDNYRILRFNPWLFSGTPQLVDHFFAELGSQLRSSGNRRVRQIGEALQDYGALISGLRFLPVVGRLADVSQAVGKALSRSSKQSAQEKRRELDDLLSELEELVVIIVDDIDRLRDDEVRDVMRLVRLVADFPNTVYVLAFDTDRVARALDTDAEAGAAYVEKIVQVAHDVPEVPPEKLSALLLQRLERAVDGIEYRLDPAHWSAVYNEIRPLFSTLRDTVRYSNSIRAPAAVLAGEVELADLLALEALRMFERIAWSRIAGAVEGLTTTTDIGLRIESREASYKEQVEAVIAEAKNKPLVTELLKLLFPASARHLGGGGYGSDWLGSWRRARRVAHPEVLRIYLSKQVPEDVLPTTTVERTAEALGEPDALKERLSELDGQQLVALFDRLEDFEKEFPAEPSGAIVALFATRPRLPETSDGGMFQLSSVDSLHRLIYRLLRPLEPADALRSVEVALGSISSFSDRGTLIRMVGYREGAGHRLAPEPDVKRLEAELVQDILGANPATVAPEPDLGWLLSVCAEYEPERTREQRLVWIDSDEFLIGLLASYRAEVRSERGRRLQLRWDRLCEAIPEDRLRERVPTLSLSAAEDSHGADAREMVRQAQEFVSDAVQAKAKLDEFLRGWGGP